MIPAAILAVAMGGLATAAGDQAQLPPTVKIGDDICAIMLEVTCRATDTSGHPVDGAELKAQHRIVAGVADFHLIGHTDATGRLRSRFCYQGSLEYQQHPPTGWVALEFWVSKPGYRDVQVRQPVKAADLLRDGLLLRQVKPYPLPQADAAARAHRVRLSIKLSH